MPPVSEPTPQQGAIPKKEILLKRYLDRTVKTIESVRDAKDEFDRMLRINEAIRMIARAIDRMRLDLSIRDLLRIMDSEPFRTLTYEERNYCYYLMLDMGVLKVLRIDRKNGKVIYVNEWWLSDRYGLHPSIKVDMLRSGRLSAFLRRIAEELRKNQDERANQRADQISRLVEAVEKVMEHMRGGKEP